MNIKIENIYQKVYITHSFFDFTSSIIVGKFTDYKCKNCGSILRQTFRGEYYIAGQDIISRNIDRYSTKTCNDLIIEAVLK